MQKLLRNAAEQHSGNAAVTPSSHDDQIGVGLFGDVRDEIRGIGVEPADDMETRLDARLDDTADLRVDLALMVYLVREHRRASGATAQALVRMHDEEPPVCLGCQFESR